MGVISIKSQVYTAQVSKNEPFTVFGSLKSMFLGRLNREKVNRILLKFSLHEIPADVEILKATLKIYVQFAGLQTTEDFTPYPLTKDWSVHTVNWHNQPPFDSNIRGETVRIAREGFYTFNITNLVEKWYQQEIPNFGIVLKGMELEDDTQKRVTTIIHSPLEPAVEIYYAPKCNCQCICSNGTAFIEKIEELDTDQFFRYSSSNNTSLIKEITYFAQNVGNKVIIVKLQVSPDNVNYVNDPGSVELMPGEMKPLVPRYYAKFTRIAAKNIYEGDTSKIKIWY